MTRRQAVLRGVCVLAAAVMVAACGSSSSSGNSANSSGSSSQTIKVGLICTCSGAGGFGAFLVPDEEVYEAWANHVNAAGGIAGHRVQVITEDDAGNPGTSLSDAQSLISQHVDAIADVSDLDQTWASAVQSAGIPVVGVLTDEMTFGTNPDFYPEGQTQLSSIYAILATAKRAGDTNLANVYCAEAAICAQSVPAFKSTGQKIGLPVPYNAEVSATAPSYAAQCLAAKQQGIKGMFIGESSAIFIRIANDCQAQGYNPTFLQEGGAFSMNEASTPSLKDALWMEFPGYPLFGNNPQAKVADAAIEQYYPGLLEKTSLFEQLAFMAWSSGLLLQDAVKGGGLTAGTAPSPKEIVTGLDSLHGDTLQGLAPPLTFSSGKPTNPNCWFTARVQDGKPTLLDNGQTTCQSGSSS